MNEQDWQWNEFQQVGTDYSTVKEVEAYDRRMASFRNVDEENRRLVDMLKLPKGADVLEIGCGTGRFSRFAAAAGYNATAIDVSPVMLEYVKEKAVQENVPLLKTKHGGFLTMDFPAGSFDAVVSGAALHHLPDVWKLVALRNIARILRAGGQFILADVVFEVKDNEAPENCLTNFIESFNEHIRPGAMGHVKKEYSTYDWIMEGLITRAGFTIVSRTVLPSSFIVYLCRK